MLENSIKRIEGLLERLAQAYGSPASFNGFRGCVFPRPEVLAKVSERRLRELGLGFRAGYVRATARRVAEGKLSLEMLKRCDYPTTKAALMRCDGVGDKVADCVALFGLQKYEAFPIDVWMERAMRYYFRKAKMTPARMQTFAHQHFGRYAGYAQQYLYHYVRTARTSAPARAAEPTTKEGYAPLS
jgi:N-glycosylase/DNA lyase